MQLGADIALLSDPDSGHLIGTVMGQAGFSKTTQDAEGNELIAEDHIQGYGGGLALTWYAAPQGWEGEGLYVDAVGQVTFYSLETKVPDGGQRGETDGWGWAISLEAGYGINLGGERDGPRLIPQIQLVYSQVMLDDFTDKDDIDVDFDDAGQPGGPAGRRCRLREDVAVGQRLCRGQPGARVPGRHRRPAVSLAPIEYDLGGTSAELGLGGTVSLLDNVNLYADVDYRIPFDDGRQGAQVIGGLRISF